MTLEKLNEKEGRMSELIEQSEENNLFESYERKIENSGRICPHVDSSWPKSQSPSDLEKWYVEKWLDELRDWE